VGTDSRHAIDVPTWRDLCNAAPLNVKYISQQSSTKPRKKSELPVN